MNTEEPLILISKQPMRTSQFIGVWWRIMCHSFSGLDLTIYGLGEAIICFYFFKLFMIKKVEAGFVHVFAPCHGIHGRLGFWIQKRLFRISGTGFQSLSVERGFWIPLVRGIPVSLSCIRDSKAQDSGFRKENFPDS